MLLIEENLMNPENFLEFARVLPEPLLLVSAEGKILASNRPLTIMLGLTSKELQGKMLFDLVLETDEKVLNYLQACSRTREMLIGSLTFHKSDGKTLNCRCEGAVIQPQSPESTAVNLLRLKNRTTANNNFILLNQKIKELTEETLWRKEAQETLSKTNERLKQTLNDLQRTQVQLVQTEKMSSLGKLVAGVAHEINNPIDLIDDNIDRILDRIQDLLEIVKLCQQEDLKPTSISIEEISVREKLAAIDLDFLRKDLSTIVNSMRAGTGRIVEIVKSLGNFSQVDEAKIKKTDIHQSIDSTLVILQHRLKPGVLCKGDTEYTHPGIEIVKEYGEIPLVYCYPSQLNQVLMNILNNAIDALEEMNIINNQSSVNSIDNNENNTQLIINDIYPPHTATCKLRKEVNPQIRIRTEVVNKNWLAIQIIDNGFGMTDEVRQRIFDPFFTTKPVGKGIGIGLYICRQIITQKHGGKLNCFSKHPQGSEFTIEIPIQPRLLF